MTATRPSPRVRPSPLADDPLWYKDAVIYEARVRSFYDADGDGIGDFRGLAQKLDYLHDLGITAVWLLPFYPSPLRDDGYDISDYRGVHPDCGTLEDFQAFVREAHRRQIRVITELVINHTSDQHPWFQRARRSPPGSRWRDYYVWSDTPERYAETRVIFQDFEPSNWAWDPVAKAYYWHRFYSHQPDLNFDSADVRREVFKALDFWLGLGVDGLRLDAIPYLYEREGTNCENLPETHEFLKSLRAHVDRTYPNRMLLAEANQWPEDAVAYFGMGGECHMAFHFPLMPRLFMGIMMENRFPILDILEQTPEIPEACQWALFLRNHDELTLEMVTDEERDYMYRVYAQDAEARINLGIRRRLAPLLGNDRRKIELMNALLFALPGTPVIYYGDEIGMGDNFFLGDRNGVRTPMQWSPDKNAGFSRANPQRLYLPVIYDPEYHYETINVEAQNNSPSSLLRWMKRVIDLRKRHGAFGRGQMTLLTPSNRKVLAFIRRHEEEILLIVSNLSATVEHVELDLSAYRGSTPVELFGQNQFPRVSDQPYFLTLGPHDYYWFRLDRGTPGAHRHVRADEDRITTLHVRGRWESVLRGHARAELERALLEYVQGRRWFGDKGRHVRALTVADVLPVALEQHEAVVLIVQVAFTEGDAAVYVVPMAYLSGDVAARLRQEDPAAVIAELVVSDQTKAHHGVLCDALQIPEFDEELVRAIVRRRQVKGELGRLTTLRTRLAGEVVRLMTAERALRPIHVIAGEQSNSSVVLGRRLMLKILRRTSDGPNPELEVGRFLTERTTFRHIAPLVGGIEYTVARRPPTTIGVLQHWVANEGDAWGFTLDQLSHYVDLALGRASQGERPPLSHGHVLDLVEREDPPHVAEMFGAYVVSARLLGQRTAEMHLALASCEDDPAFSPESYTTLYQRSLYQSMRNATLQTFQRLRESLPRLPENLAQEVTALLDQQPRILEILRTISGRRIETARIRVHGDYHLGQVLHTGKDFIIIDFEGEPSRPVAERRIKRSPVRDVVGMLRSFDYAGHTVLHGAAGARVVRADDVPVLEPWIRLWVDWVSAAFLRGYLATAASAAFLPSSRDDLRRLMNVLMMEKSVYEVAYELDNRPDWLPIPIRGIRRLVEDLR